MTAIPGLDGMTDWLDPYERDYSRLDEDRLASEARALRGSGGGRMDTAVGAWLARHPSPARLDIASVILETLWNRSLGAVSVDPTVVESLLGVRTLPGVTDEGEATSVRALVQAYGAGVTPALGAWILDALTDALGRPNANPAVHPLIRRTLAEAGRRV